MSPAPRPAAARSESGADAPRRDGTQAELKAAWLEPEPPDEPSLVLRLLAAGLALLLGLGVGACVGQRLRLEPAVEPRPLADPWRTAGQVPVRLAAAEGLVRLELEDGSGTPLELWRDGAGVGRGRQRASEPWIRVETAPGAEGLRWNGRLYPGALLVEPCPAGGLRVTNLVPLEPYVRSVVAAELSLWSANPAELAAQAIAARSYAAAKLDAASVGRTERPFVWDDTRDQVYRGSYEPDAAGKRRGLDRALDAGVEGTRGTYLMLGGLVVQARFHAACGGRTARAADVFGGASRSMQSVPCEPCAAAVARALEARPLAAASPAAPADDRGLGWEFTASAEELAAIARRLGLGEGVQSLRPVTVESERWISVELSGELGSRRLPLNQLRELLGYERLQSGRILRTWPRAGEPILAGLYFEGFGSGHGVGLCQFGARGYGERGFDADAILRHYFPSASLVRR